MAAGLDTLGGWDDEEPSQPRAQTDPSLEAAWPGAASGAATPQQAANVNQAPSNSPDLTAQTGVQAPSAAATQPQTTPQTSSSPNYTTQVQAISSASSPQEAAVHTDTLARTLATDLQNDGHEVEWQDNTLLVDGRPYTVGGSDNVQDDGVPWNNGAGTSAGMLNGLTTEQLWTDYANQNLGGAWTGGAATANPQAAAARGNLQAIVDRFNSATGAHASVASGDRVDFGDGRGPVDVIRDSGGGGSQFWFGSPQNSDGSTARSTGGGIGDIGQMRIGGDNLTQPMATPAGLDYESMWGGPTGPTYVPQHVSTDTGIPGYDQTLRDAGRYTAGTLADPNVADYKAGQLGGADLPWDYDSLLRDIQSGNPVSADEDALIQRILRNPESMGPQAVEMLKAKDAEEQMLAAQQEDQALKRFGFSSGYTDSPWLASERASTARDRDASIIGNRRNIDITAAQTNAADRLKAGELGASYQGQRAGQKQQAVSTAGNLSLAKAGEERQRFDVNQSAKQKEEELALGKAAETRQTFNANQSAQQAQSASQQQAVATAVDAAFRASSAGTDRAKLNADMDQAAARLGLDKDKMKVDYITHTIDDMTKRYGIDLGFRIDSAKLAQQSDQFKMDLMFRLKQLQEQHDQFGANLGLGYDQLNSANMNRYWDAIGG